MNTEKTSYYMVKLRRRYRMLRLCEISLWALAGAGVLYVIVALITKNDTTTLALSAMAGISIFIFRFFSLNLHKISFDKIATFINQRYPALQESADLLLKDVEPLTTLQQLQQQRTAEAFKTIYPSLRLPNRLGLATTAFSITTLLIILFEVFPMISTLSIPEEKSSVLKSSMASHLPPVVKNVTITVTPPGYTGLPRRVTNNPQLEATEGSIVQWNFHFSDSIETSMLFFSDGDTVTLTVQGEEYVARKTFYKAGFYQLYWKHPLTVSKTSDYYKVDVLKDQPPAIAISNLPQSTTLSLNDKLSVDVKTSITDDYGLREAYITATVSKGSGESVKFREEKLRFSSPVQWKDKHADASLTIDLVKLGLEPGDELYFYAEALDNRPPEPNRSRTETYFVALQDTASENVEAEAGLGVDLMPEYFRSQRQIIIDTEKLLKEKRRITREEFGNRSNALAHDQKVLRLKYGEFLGEEFESGIAIESENPTSEDTHEEEDVVKKFGHAHDHENEHNLVTEGKQNDEHDHEHHKPLQEAMQKQNPLEGFMHMHDDPEEATFFIQSIRAKLKAALTVMWDAELHLRLYTPEKSLPFQYKALKLLKEISNDSRIYVHKTGFDPPPLKEEKRLSGDLTEIKNTTHVAQHGITSSHEAIRKALELIEISILQNSPVLQAGDKKVLTAAGAILAELALEQPLPYLKALSAIQAMNRDEVDRTQLKEMLMIVRAALWKALPQQATTPTATTTMHHSLDRQFIENLKTMKHD